MTTKERPDLSIERLMQAEIFAYRKWVEYRTKGWHRLAASMNRRVKSHPDYRGVR